MKKESVSMINGHIDNCTSLEEHIEVLQEEWDFAQEPCYVKSAILVAIDAIKKQIPLRVKELKTEFYSGYHRKDYYCPVCGKQQKIPATMKRVTDGWYCERCGQKLKVGDSK